MEEEEEAGEDEEDWRREEEVRGEIREKMWWARRRGVPLTNYPLTHEEEHTLDGGKAVVLGF